MYIPCLYHITNIERATKGHAQIFLYFHRKPVNSIEAGTKMICIPLSQDFSWSDFISAIISSEDFAFEGGISHFIIKEEHKILSGLGVLHRTSLIELHVSDLTFNSTDS